MKNLFKILYLLIICIILLTVPWQNISFGECDCKKVAQKSNQKNSSLKKEEKASIKLNKKVYKLEEKIKATIKSDKSIYVWGGYHWSVQRWKNKKWVDIRESGCKTYPKCKKIKSENGKEKVSSCQIKYCERPKWYKIQPSHSYWSWNWGQLYRTEEKKVKCLSKRKIIKSKCYVYHQVLPGKYRLKLEYATSIDQKEPMSRKKATIKYARKNFIIKKECINSNTM